MNQRHRYRLDARHASHNDPATDAMTHWRDDAVSDGAKKSAIKTTALKVWRSFSEEKAARESSDCSIAKPAHPMLIHSAIIYRSRRNNSRD
jgi:hypothetical protein